MTAQTTSSSSGIAAFSGRRIFEVDLMCFMVFLLSLEVAISLTKEHYSRPSRVLHPPLEICILCARNRLGAVSRRNGRYVRLGKAGMDGAIRRHCAELERCNQRGGRMLSVFELLAARTLDLDLAAYFMARISRGASFMVGARPGGAGKTTVMCALLNFVPADTVLTAATGKAMLEGVPATKARQTCFICHEIGPGPYFAYLWGEPLRRYCALSAEGCMLATNLHADDIDEVQMQVCVENGVPQAHFNAFNLLAFLRIDGGGQSPRRRVALGYVSDGQSPHRLVFQDGRGLQPVDTGLDMAYYQECRNFIAHHADGSLKTIEKTRRLVLDFLECYRE